MSDPNPPSRAAETRPPLALDGAAAAAAAIERDEPAIVGRLQSGDDDAFELVVRAYSPRLLAVARRLVGNDEEAQDALQDALLSAARNIGSFAGDAKLSTWLHRVTVNASLMRLRTRRRRPEMSIDSLLPIFMDDGHQVDPPARWKELPSDGALQAEARDRIREAIDTLPENYRTVLVLRDIEGLDTAETAAVLGVSDNAVKTRLHRARQALRSLLDPLVRRGDL